MQNLSRNFFGLKVAFTSNSLLFTTVFKDKFDGFLKDVTEDLMQGTVTISFGKFFNNKRFDWQKIDSHIQIDVKQNAIEKKHYYLGQLVTSRLIFDIKQAEYSIEIVEKRSLTFFILNIFSKGQLQRQLYQNIIKLFIEQPLFHLLCKEKKLYCLHASGVAHEQMGILFYGLNGVGKSTLAHYLLQKYNYTHVSDNYTLVSDSTMYANPESVRLAEDSINVLQAKRGSKFGFGKMNIHIQPNGLKKCNLALIVFVSRSNSFSLKKISQYEFEKLLSLQQINGEDVQSSVLANLSYFSKKTRYSGKRCKYYHVTMSSYTDLEKLANELHT